MKRLITLVFLTFLLMPAMAQMIVIVSGTVTNSANGSPIVGQAVQISADSSGGYFYFNTVYTGTGGFYADTLYPTTAGGLLYVKVWDCNQVMHQDTCNFAGGNTYFIKNFSICYNAPATCDAIYSYYQQNPNTFQFTDFSTGNPDEWQWNFGDGSTSTVQNPLHTYGAPGYYSVKLRIHNILNNCWDSTTQMIYAGDTTAGCQANFTSYSQGQNSIQFLDLSTGNPTSWDWYFGDGGTSNLQNPVHLYPAPGSYNVILSIGNPSTGCIDSIFQTIVVQDSTGGNCQADFYSIPDSSNSQQVMFFNNSVAQGTLAYFWNFGDPASGSNNTSSVENPVHYFTTPGTYNVCLTIQSNDSSCYDMTCQTIQVSGSNPCQAQFTYFPDSNLNQPLTIQFLDLSPGAPTSWYWNFGDSTGTSTVQHPVYTYAAPGTYYVCLTIQCQGVVSTWCQNIIVWDTVNCESYFNYSINNLQVSFSGAMTDPQPATYVWDFGDGNTGSGQNLSHTYAIPGSYNVVLTTTTTATPNCTYSSLQTIQVGDTNMFNQVYGQVFAGGIPISNGIAMIFSLDTGYNYLPYFDLSIIDSMGVYIFPYVPQGNFVVLALPTDSTAYMPTYYGDVINWTAATVISLGDPVNPYNINLIPAQYYAPGPGGINGQINQPGLKSGMAERITMMMMNEQGQPLSFDRVDDEGAFGFGTLAYGTYYLHAEMAGVTSDLIKVVLDAEHPVEDVVLTFTGNRILGISNPNDVVQTWMIYPNPVTDQLNIGISLVQGTSLQIEILNLNGQVVATLSEAATPGANHFRMAVPALPAGIYTVRLTSADGIILTKKMIKSR